MREAAAIFGCFFLLLLVCAGAGGYFWYRAEVSRNQALYAQRVRAEKAALQAREAELRAEAARREAEEQESRAGGSSLDDALFAVTDGDEDARVSGLLELARKPRRTDALLDAVISALEDDSPVVRNLAATLLGNMGTDAAPAAVALARALADPSAREAALYALRRIGSAGAAAIPALEELGRAAEPEVQDATRRALEAMRGE